MRKPILAAAVVVVLASTAVFAEEMVENPQYASWAKFKVGTSVKMQTDSVTSVQGTEMKSTMKITSVLKELTADKAVLEMTTVMVVNGKEMAMPAQKVEVPAKVAKGSTPNQPAGVKVTKVAEGDEEVTVAGKTYKCHWVESKMSSDQMEATTKVWNCPDVPGGMVKSITNTTKPMKSKVTMQLVEAKPAS